MSFPVYADTYQISGRNYRRNPFSGAAPVQPPIGNGDTADLYEDDADEDELLDCLPAIPKIGAPDELEEAEDAAGPAAYQAPAQPEPMPSSSVQPPIAAMAPPPGFEKKVVTATKKEKQQKPEKPKQPASEAQPAEAAVADVWIRCEEDVRIEQSGQKFRARLEVASAFHGRLIGFRGTILKEMEASTRCRIRIPNKNEGSDLIDISSTVGIESVQRCLDRIDIIVIKARKESRPTHFLALPMNTPEILEGYDYFKRTVKAMPEISDVCKDEKLYMIPAKLHLTLAVVRLFTKDEKAQAAAALAMAGERIRKLYGRTTLKVSIAGLQIMNDDPTQVNVLYAGVRGEKVQEVANLVRDVFVEQGLCEPDKSDVKLHMTLMNSRYLAEETNSRRTNFDAKALLDEMSDFWFGDVTSDKIHLCAMSTVGADGFYESIETLSIA
ncbi:unnamed protein product, partial [Mesorhabditis spiculigera]